MSVGKFILLLLFWPIALPIMIFDKRRDKSERLLLAAVFIMLILIVVFARPKRKTQTQKAVVRTPAQELLIYPKTPTPFTVRIDGISYGTYGRDVVINDGTPDRLAYIGYFVPTGTYRAVTNRTNTLWDQISILSPDTIWDGGFEYPAHSDAVLVKPGETASVYVPDGWYIKVVPPADITITK